MAKKIKIVAAGTPMGSWMLTFSDMNTLLLTFFVLLFSMSTIATDKFEEMAQAKQGDGLGLRGKDARAYSSKLVFDPSPLLPKNAVSSALNVFRSIDEKGSRQVNVPDGVEFQINDAADGVVTILIADKLLFEPGQTELDPDSLEFLEKVRLFLQRILTVMPRRVIVEGHTDNSTPEEEGYIMSAKRAEAVLLFLLADGVLPPELFSIVGYGASKPRLPNTSDENRAKNRRVRIYLEPLESPDEIYTF